MNVLKATLFKGMKDAAVEGGALFGVDRREMESDAADTRELQFDQRVERLRNMEIRSHEQLQRLLVGLEASFEYMLRCISAVAGELFRTVYKAYAERARNGAYPMPPMMLLSMIIIPTFKEAYAIIVDHITELDVATDDKWRALFNNEDRRSAFRTHTSGALSIVLAEMNGPSQSAPPQGNRGGKARRLEGGAYGRDPQPPQEWRSAGGRGKNGRSDNATGGAITKKNGKGKGGKGARASAQNARPSQPASARARDEKSAVLAFAEQVRERLPAGTPKAQRFCGLLNTRGYCGEPNCGYLHRKAPWVKNRFSSPPPDGQ